MRLSHLLRTALLGLIFIGLGTPGHAGMTAFTDRGKIDFDNAMGLLNPYGTWAKVDGLWAFTPLDHGAPYTNGRWIYTEFGWTWRGRLPHSWITEHYGYWKRGSDQLWAWYPGSFWLPQTVEIRASPDGVGWRSAQVDADGNFVEEPSDRFTKTDEWTFVTPAQFAGPITPAVIAKGPAGERLLEESTESSHSYMTYRQLDRPGPHPADFVNLGDGGMFAPMTPQERQAAQRPTVKPVSKSDVPLPALVGTDAEDPNGDKRQVKYWLTMSLPQLWTPLPDDAKRNEVYLYRPDIFQDQDGIERRITFWLDPKSRANETVRLQDVLNRRSTLPTPSATATTAAVVPAEPAQPSAPTRDPFSSPLFDDSFHPASTHKTPSASTKSPLSAAGAPVDTNAAPAVPAEAQ